MYCILKCIASVYCILKCIASVYSMLRHYICVLYFEVYCILNHGGRGYENNNNEKSIGSASLFRSKYSGNVHIYVLVSRMYQMFENYAKTTPYLHSMCVVCVWYMCAGVCTLDSMCVVTTHLARTVLLSTRPARSYI